MCAYLVQPNRYAILMAVMVPREKWTDDRLDDLQAEMRAGFARVDAQIERVDGDIKEIRREMNARFENLEARLDVRFNAIDARFEALNRNMMAGFFVVVAVIVGSNAL